METALIEALKRASYTAGEAILAIYDKEERGIELKADQTPLTLADQASHEAIMRELERTPYPVLSEEGASIPYEVRSKWEYFWMVDPLDGTKEFIKRNGEFTVNIALIHANAAVFGMVYVPVTGELFYGGKDTPAKLKKNGTERALSASEGLELEQLMKRPGLRVVASRSHLNADTQSFLDKLDQPEIVSMGSSLKFMALASGIAEVYPRYAPTMEWDTAAAHAVISSLGYRVLRSEDHKELQYNKEDLLNPHFICY